MPKPKDNAPYFYRKLAGYRQSISGAQPEPKSSSLDISFPIFDSDDATLNSNEASIQVQLINSSSDNPAGFDLSFTFEDAGGATITDGLKATTFDNGDEFSPSYVLEAGQTRTIELVRGPSAPTYGSSQIINVNALLPNGGTASYPVTVEGVDSVSGVFSAYAPLLMVDYASLNNEGSLKDTPLYDGGSTYPDYTTDLIRTSSTDVNGLVGYIETGSTGAAFGGRAGFPDFSTTNVLSNSTVNANGGFHSLRGQRTLIYIFETGSTMTSQQISYTGDPNLLPLSLRFQGTSFGSSLLEGANAAPGSSTGVQRFDGSGQHTVEAASIACTLEQNTLYLYAVSYEESADGTTGTLTHRWKKSGDPDGFSYLSYQRNPADGTNSGTYNVYCMINSKSGFGSAARPVKHRFHGLSHSLISDADFNAIANLIGL